MSKERVLITGATGFIGSHIVAELLLEQSYEVHCIVRGDMPDSRLEALCALMGVNHSEVNYHSVELEDEDALYDLLLSIAPTVVYNCAAAVSLSEGASNSLVRQNVDIVETLCFAMRRACKDTLLIHLSSIAAIGSTSQSDGYINERSEVMHIERLSPYALSKYLSENVVWRASRLGLPVVVLNPSVVLGLSAESSAQIERYFSMVRNSLPFYTKSMMGYVDVRDVASVAVRLIQERDSVVGQRYIISGYNLTNRELSSAIARSIGVRAPKMLLPKWVARLVFGLSGRGRMVASLYANSSYSSKKILTQFPDMKFHTLEQSVEWIATRYK